MTEMLSLGFKELAASERETGQGSQVGAGLLQSAVPGLTGLSTKTADEWIQDYGP